jgi:Brp/Blh family beta-carotene 15,15'-monooxygenase
MSEAQVKLFTRTRNFSSIAVSAVILLSLAFSRIIDETDISWQVAIALVALAVGIPHGALDHLVTLPRASIKRMGLFILVYVLIAALAVIAILQWNVYGFIGVVVMSALHFGIGDTAFINELERAKGSVRANRLAQFLYAVTAGALPVVIPLTNKESTSALAAVNDVLINWHGGLDEELINLVTGMYLVTVLVLSANRRWRDLIDINLLLLLAFFTPPLVAFAAYFGTWHAMRHTARLTLNLRSSQESLSNNQSAKAFRQAVLPGVPALVGTFIVSLGIALFTPGKLSDEFLWLSLVVVWALTVPHMMVTARLDKAALE